MVQNSLKSVVLIPAINLVESPPSQTAINRQRMKSWAIPVLHCSAFVRSLFLAKAASLPSLISSDSNLNLVAPTGANLSTFPNFGGNDFRYFPHYRGPLLPDIACIMVCVSAMGELALESIDQPWSANTWTLENHPQVTLAGGNRGKVTIVRWVMTTINVAIKDMMIHNRFQTSQFQGEYLDVEAGPLRVAVVEFYAPHMTETIALANHTKHAMSHNAKAVSVTNNGMATMSINFSDPNGNASSNDDQMQAEVTYLTKEIPRNDLFMSMIQTLLNLGPFPNAERISVLSLRIPTITTTVKFRAIRVASAPPRLRLQYGSLIALMTKLPEMLLRENQFREMDILAKKGNVVVGKATIRLDA